MAGSTLDRAREGLRALAGLAPSPVLEARLQRAAGLLPALPSEPRLEDAHWAALLDATTVQETQLFRSPAQLALIEARLPPLLLQARDAERPLRLLSAGCSTGEEAFSLAAIGLHLVHSLAPGARIEVVGVDVSRPALHSAAQGVIGPHLGAPLASVPAHHRPWLVDAGGQPRLHPSLRATLRFERASLLDLPQGLGGFDVILCRNVLIYMDDQARRQVLTELADRLRPGGMLALGATDAAPGGTLRPAGHAVYAHG
jgi:chemotaxis protein methyltransferase CheR